MRATILGRRAEVAAACGAPGRAAWASWWRAASACRSSTSSASSAPSCPKQVPDVFAALAIPLKVTATDFFGHTEAVFDSGDLNSALAASAAIPAVFRPVRRDGRLFIDGGIYNPVPFDLIEGEADYHHRHRRRRRADAARPQPPQFARPDVRRHPADDAVDHRHEAEDQAPGTCCVRRCRGSGRWIF